MKAFHNDPKVKAKYLQRVQAHREADDIIHGTYWQDGKGCAVGCTIHSDNHERYPIELGIPVWLAYLEDSIFESLPNGKAKDWPVRFLQSIKVGADLEPVRPKFLKWLLVDKDNGVLRLLNGEHDKKDEYTSKVKDAIAKVVDMLDEWIATGIRNESAAWSAAWSASWSAAKSAKSAAKSAESAESAAKSAAESAESAAKSAAESAESAWSAAKSAAESAWSAAESASWSASWSAAKSAESAWSAAKSAESAWSAAWSAESEQLLKLLSEA